MVLVGCADDPTQTLIRFEADAELESRADQIRVRLFRVDGVSFYDESPTLDFALSDRLVPVEPNDNPDERFRVLAELLEDGAVLATVRAETGFIENDIREIWLRFDAACVSTTCGERESCRDGTCGGDCVDPAERGGDRPTRAYACSSVDAGTDVGPADVGADVSDAGVDAFDAGPRCDDCDCDDVCTEEGCVPNIRVSALSLGRDHACAIDAMGRLWCWGDNTNGEIGIGLPETGPAPPVDTPTRVVDDEFGEPVTHVSLGHQATGVRLRDGRIFTWGDDEFRKLGQGACCGDRGRFDIPNLLSGGWVNVAYGADHACAIEDDDQSFDCWGRNTSAQCAQDPDISGNGQFSMPRGNPYSMDWILLSGGDRHTCGIRALEGGRLFCWGDYERGRLGVLDLTADQIAPIRVSSGSYRWTDVSAGANHTCGITDGQLLLCWGAHTEGQLGVSGGGDRQQPNRVEPEPSPLAVGWTDISAGALHTCGVHEGTLYCWGSNLGMALGTAEVATTTNVPTLVLENVETVSAGDDFTCAIDNVGALYCWGRDDAGRLGLGRIGDQATPARVCFSE